MKSLSRIALVVCVLGFAAFTFGGAFAGEITVKIGAKAPAFHGIDENGQAWNSKDIVGKKILVLYFFPADFTGGCTKQACSFRDDIEKLHGQGIEVVGVSGDSSKTHHMFKAYHKLPFTLLADEKGQLAKTFGVPLLGKGGTSPAIDASGVKIAMPRGVTISRYTVVIDKNGTVAAKDRVTNPAGDSKRIAALAKKLNAK